MDTRKILLEELILNHGDEAARIVEQLKMDQLVPFFNNLPVMLSVTLLQEMDAYLSYRCLDEIDEEKSANVLDKMPLRTSASFMRRMAKEKRERILKSLEVKTAISLEQMLYHLPGTAGAEMDPQVPVITEDLNVKEVFDSVKKSKQQSYEYIYITNQDGKLSGIVKLEDLVIADSKEKIISLLIKEIPRLYSEVEIGKITDHPGWEEYSALPVVDRADTFLGALFYSVVKKSGKEKTKGIPRHAVMASNALGELYRIGLSGLIYSTLSDTEARSSKTTEESE